ncbi:MAG: FmdB family zinc ribbon protein [Candidatus Latescibacterota bacterium]
MPIYEYRCTACDHAFETLVQGNQKPSCPCCKSKKLQKQFSAFAVNGATGNVSFPSGGG